MIRGVLTVLAAMTALLMAGGGAGATSRIKDLANIEGVRQNQLIGYGLVVGLNGTGDTLNNNPFTKQSLQAMLERMGVNIRGATIAHRQRRRRDGDRQPAAVRHPGHPDRRHGLRARRRQEPAGRHPARHAAARRRRQRLRGRPGLARRSAVSRPRAPPPASPRACRRSGASPTAPSSNARSNSRSNRLPNVRLALRNADFTTAKRIAAAVNDYLGSKTAEPIDPSTVQLTIPGEFKGNVVALLTEIEQLQVEPDLSAKIVIDERSGIIVMGRDVRVATVAVAQGNLTVTISESPQVSQPNPLSRGRTVVTPNSRVGVQEDGKKLALVKDGVSLQQLVDGLNGLGIGPRDLIGILQAIKAAGAIQADIEVM